MPQLVLALTTFPDSKSAEKFAQSSLKAGLAACVSIVPGVTSIYRWKGKIEKGSELLLIMKTSKGKVKALEEAVKKGHPYELPEFLSVPAEGSGEYMAWIGKETRR
ncbi:MAG: divalent-cation tolerance protein CutA [Candidatus Aenigmatarchaeota archaeon]